ncbi:saccharopine dehydrogenase family protein [Natronobiforma cellulositropha]|uniref:saccharopine dehydrogenase family protein n=1 Tax=Natronobiforma cellulositropha TaxID=1679076 RepID=UPI0021D6016D|nr:saccharopine dehydrogenase NADP-binding domain-containing protein [Natronobiforma cellulositropha]
MDTLLVYGSYGYTGDLIVREALARGGAPVLAGRDPDRLREQADAHGLEHRAFAIEDDATLGGELEPFDAVVNCAGPFVDTADSLVSACLEAGTDYLDITGEYEVFARLAATDERARDAGVTLLPGVGFEVVPSDCLAGFLAGELPTASDLTLAISGRPSFSRGTARTLLRYLGDGGLIRRDGQLYRVPRAHDTREVDFGDGRGPTRVVTAPWGDIVTAPYSTGIGNVTGFADVPNPAIWAMRANDTLSLERVLGSRPLRAALERLVDVGVGDPSPAERERDRVTIWGEVTDGERTVSARLETPDPYTLTAESAVVAAERLLDGGVDAGFQTPVTAFGHEVVTECSGVEGPLLETREVA